MSLGYLVEMSFELSISKTSDFFNQQSLLCPYIFKMLFREELIT